MLAKTYDALISNGETAFRTYLLFRNLPELARRQWNDAAPKPDEIEGQNLADARLVKARRRGAGDLHGRFSDGLGDRRRRSSAATATR